MREEYIVTTSEFDVVKKRLASIEAGQKVKSNDKNKPTLRKRTEQDPNKTTTTGTNGGGQNGDDTSSDDDRPTLKRRPDPCNQ